MKISDSILVLPSWYPSRVDKFSGDFIQRHIQAIALKQNQHILFVVKDESLTVEKEIIQKQHDNYSETIIYYKPRLTNSSILNKIISHYTYQRLFKTAIKNYVADKGIPKLVHVHVAMKAGMIAVWAQKKWHIPYIVSEHWSGYLKEAYENIYNFPTWYKAALKNILSNASSVTAVSSHLATSINIFLNNVKPVVIPNVVDKEIFFPSPQLPLNGPVFIHASTMNFPKNIEGIISAMTIVCKTQPGAKLKLYGPAQEEVKEMVSRLNLGNHVEFHGDVPQSQLAVAMRQSHALILYSRYETFGCVIIEAHACELPVIVSDIPIFHELVKEGEDGYFVPVKNIQALADAMLKVINENPNRFKFDIEPYTYATVANQFIALYEKISPA